MKPTMDTTMKPTYEDLIKALEMAHYELLTLNPRLTPQFRKSVQQVMTSLVDTIQKAKGQA